MTASANVSKEQITREISRQFSNIAYILIVHVVVSLLIGIFYVSIILDGTKTIGLNTLTWIFALYQVCSFSVIVHCFYKISRLFKDLSRLI
jgi:hypothetical protein